jgi:hypothetical protein
MPSFTVKIADIQQIGAVVDVVLIPSVSFLQAAGIKPTEAKATKVLAMIDTGASCTVIRKDIAAGLGLSPIGTTLINTPSSANVTCYQFNISMVFPNNLNIPSIIVTEAPLQGQHIQCLIGRDILKNAVLIYTGYDNSFTLSF